MSIAVFIALVLVIVGGLMSASGNVWGLVLAFQDSILWGLAYLLIPFAALVFILKRWSRAGARNAFWLQFVGAGVSMLGVVFKIALEAAIPFGNSNSPPITQHPTDTSLNRSMEVASGSLEPVSPWESRSIVSCRISETPPSGSSGEMSPPYYSSSPYKPFTKFDVQECMRLGDEAFEQQDYERAEVYYRRAYDAEPFGEHNAFEALGRAHSLAAQQQFEQHRAEMRGSRPIARPARYTYQETMRVGYAAFQQKDYQTALINFERAIEVRPGDRLALEAINNTRSIIQQQQASGTSSTR
ncbi:MAG: tetratricopeptide repeat protein [Kaiparowitsia implicata GSE-PSE-MK54-09C]|jgi:hypothetical protein|nr:tetratricopeptide repeat protein [Kaiparowitsia implicata GSE-PSE-MK54-09C]